MEQDRIKLTDTSRYLRDPHSKGLVSNDKAGLGAYKARRRDSEQITVLKDDINTLQEQMKALKEMCREVLAAKASA